MGEKNDEIELFSSIMLKNGRKLRISFCSMITEIDKKSVHTML